MPLKVRCPLCKKLTPYEGNAFRPFCSERCKKTDLGTWASEGYAIAGKSTEVEEENVSTSDHFDSETDPGSTVH